MAAAGSHFPGRAFLLHHHLSVFLLSSFKRPFSLLCNEQLSTGSTLGGKWGVGDTKGHTETLSLLGGLTMANQVVGARRYQTQPIMSGEASRKRGLLN